MWSTTDASASRPKTTRPSTCSGWTTSTTGASRASSGGAIASRPGTAPPASGITVARTTPTQCAHCGSTRSSRTPTCWTPGSAPACCRSPPSAGRQKTRRLRRLLSHLDAGHRLRHPLLLGRPHDHARLPSDGRAEARQARHRALPRGLHPRPGARRRPPEDVQDQGQRRRSHRSHREVRHRRGALHPGRHGRARHRHRLQRKPHRKLSRLRQQDLERRPLPLHERGSRRREQNVWSLSEFAAETNAQRLPSD